MKVNTDTCSSTLLLCPFVFLHRIQVVHPKSPKLVQGIVFSVLLHVSILVKQEGRPNCHIFGSPRVKQRMRGIERSFGGLCYVVSTGKETRILENTKLAKVSWCLR